MAQHTITSPPAGSVVEIAPGDVLSVLLPERGGGYRWQPVLDPGVLALEEDRTEATPGTAVGGAITRVFRLRARSSGRAAVSFLLRRQWERDEPPLSRHDITVVVHE